jgi:UDP:flavonoid glycosyltransferase YjiC (YdhE family)
VAKGLIVGLPLQGHMTPLLALVRDLVSRGDDLVVYSTPLFATDIEQTGARFRRYRSGRLDDLTQLPDRTEEISLLLMGIVGEVLDADLPAMRAERADYIVTDLVAPWGHWIAQLIGVPVVTSVTTFAINCHVLAFAASHGVRPKSVPCDGLEAEARIESTHPASEVVTLPSGPRSWRVPHRVRSIRLEHRLHLTRIPTARRHLRSVVSFRGSTGRAAHGATRGVFLAERQAPHCLRLPRHAVQRGRWVLSTVLRGVY